MSGNSTSSWMSNRLFPIGLGVTLLCGFIVFQTFPRLYKYYTWSKRNGFDWCYECSGWTSILGPEGVMAVLAASIAGLTIGIMTLFLIRQRFNTHESHLDILRQRIPFLIIFAVATTGVTLGVYYYLGFSMYGEIMASVISQKTIQLMTKNDPEILEGAVKIDNASLDRIPKLHEVIIEAYNRKESRGSSILYATDLNTFEYDSISDLIKKDSSARRSPGEFLGFTLKYNELYYNVNIARK